MHGVGVLLVGAALLCLTLREFLPRQTAPATGATRIAAGIEKPTVWMIASAAGNGARTDDEEQP